MNKKEIRRSITEQKKSMTADEIVKQSRILADKFCALKEYREAEYIFAYVSYNQEVMTEFIINRGLAEGKRIAVPKVRGKEMDFRFINSLDDCIEGYMGIREPSDDTEIAENIPEKVLMLMPGLAFDRAGNRLGYGGGFYDRYLAEHKETAFCKIALGYDFQLVDRVETEEYDMGVDLIILPSEEIKAFESAD